MDTEKELSTRSKQVLRLVVEEYVANARAVGSEGLKEKYDLPFSSATLRAEMAELERRGLLTHLHTSAGRVPSDAGYRMFVENLMGQLWLDPSEMRRVEHQFHQVEDNPDLERWAELSAAVLAQLARNAALVTTPRSPDARLKHLQLMHLYERSALLVAVMDDGRVRQSICVLPYEAPQEELNMVSAALNAAFAGFLPERMPERMGELRGPAAEIAPQVLGALAQSGSLATISQSGLQALLSQPEFKGAEQAQRVVGVLEGGELVSPLAARVGAQPGVHVIIGSEMPLEDMRSCSIVAAAYGTGRGGLGLITVVGPTRMQYQRTISSVLYVSRLLSQMLKAEA